MRKVTVFLLVMAVSGCLPKRMNSIMRSWEGQHFSILLMSWGPPQQVYDDGQGGRILIWTVARQWTTPGIATTTTTASAQAWANQVWGQAQSFTTYRAPITTGYTAYRMFQTDSRGIIVRWSWRGL